jgi:hypothetical protein
MPKSKIKKFVSYQQKDDAAITPIEYNGLQAADDHFNAALFESKLPDCFITYQRKANSGGYFAPDRFAGRLDDFARRG